MKLTRTFTPPPLARLALLAAALVALTTAPPALAQSPLAGTPAAQTEFCAGGKGTLDNLDFNTYHAHEVGGTTYSNASPLKVLKAGQGDHTRDLYIAKAENWTADIAIGDAGRCAGDRSDSTNLVSFHIDADRLYDAGTSVARACTYWTGGSFQFHDAGFFTVRIYGRICARDGVCTNFRPSGVEHTGEFGCWLANSPGGGYSATFAPGPNCGPAKWPTKYLRDIGGKPYSEWCDFVVNGGRVK